MYLQGTTNQDELIKANQGSQDQANQNQPGVFPLSQIDNAVPPFADPPISEEMLSPPPPRRKDSILELSIPGDGARNSENEIDPDLTEELPEPEVSPSLGIADSHSSQSESQFDKPDPEQKTETNFAVDQMNSPSPQTKQVVDLNNGQTLDRDDQDSLAASAAAAPIQDMSTQETLTQNLTTEQDAGQDRNLAQAADLDPFAEFSQRQGIFQETNPVADNETSQPIPDSTVANKQNVVAENPAESPQQTAESSMDPASKKNLVAENPAELPQKIAESRMEPADKTDLTRENPPSQIEATGSDAEQTKTEIVGQPAGGRNNSSTQATSTGFEFLNWLIPCLVSLGLLIAILRTYRRRNEPVVKVDMSKPIRGAFRKRESVVESKNPNPNLASETTQAPETTQSSLTVSKTSDDSVEFDFDRLNSEFESDRTSDATWSEVDADEMAIFNETPTESKSSGSEFYTDSLRSQPEELEPSSDSGQSAQREEVLESSDSDFDFFAADESDVGYDFDAEPAQSEHAALKQVEASDFDDDQRNILSEQESDEAYIFDSETENEESVYMDASSDERSGAIAQQVDVSEEASPDVEVAPQSAWFSESIAGHVEEAIEGGSANSLTNVISTSEYAPTASNETKAKSGRFSRWFKRKSDESETIQKNEPPAVSANQDIGNFHLADEDLGSLFSKPSTMASNLQNESNKADAPPSDIQDEDSSCLYFDDEIETESAETAFDDKQHSENFHLLDDSNELSASVPSNDHRALMAELQEENSAIAAQLAAARAELEAFSLQQSHQLEEYRMEQQVRAKEMDDQTSLIKQLQSELAAAIADRDQLREKLQDELQDELEELKAEKNTLLSKFDSAQSEGNHLISKISELEAFSLQQKHQLDEYLLELQARSKETEEQRSSINRLQVELTEAVSDRGQLTEKLDNLNSAKDEIEKQLTARLQETMRLSESIAELQGNLAAATSQRDKLQEDFQQANSARESLSQLQDDLRTELEELAADKDELLAKLETAQDANGDLITKTSDLELQIAQLREQLEQASSSIAAGNVAGTEVIGRATKEKFTRLFKAYERERRLRKQAEQFLTEAEEQIVQLRNKSQKKGK